MINPIEIKLIDGINREQRFKLMQDTSMNDTNTRQKITFTIMQNNGDDFYQMLWQRNTEYVKTRLSTINSQQKRSE